MFSNKSALVTDKWHILYFCLTHFLSNPTAAVNSLKFKVLGQSLETTCCDKQYKLDLRGQFIEKKQSNSVVCNISGTKQFRRSLLVLHLRLLLIWSHKKCSKYLSYIMFWEQDLVFKIFKWSNCLFPPFFQPAFQMVPYNKCLRFCQLTFTKLY